MKSEQIKQITSTAIEELVAALNAGRSEVLTKYLVAIGRFHRYSFLNVMLIERACPHATRVAGYQTWKTLGRYVKKGEKGIMILAPVFRRRTNKSNEAEDANLDSNDSRALTGFRAVYVFDESMTSGNPLPQIGSINGDPGAHRERLEQFVREQGIALEYSEDIAPAKGVSEGGKIKLLPGQSPAETVATLVHELAHERLHRAERRASTTKRTRETEAEAVAFVVCESIGLETGTASADYISLWNSNAAVLLESLELVQRTAAEIIAAITPDKLLPPEKRRLDSHFDAIWMQRSEAVETAKVHHVQREDMAEAVNVHRCCQARVVNLNPGDAVLYYNPPPLSVNCLVVWQQAHSGLNHAHFAICFGDRQAEAVAVNEIGRAHV